MKSAYFFLLISSLVISSCSPPVFYQVYKTNIPSGMKIEGDFIIFEDRNCKVYYNLWSQNGNMGFKIFNKGVDDLKLNLEKSFFVINGVAYDYYLNRKFIIENSKLNTKSNLKMPYYEVKNSLQKNQFNELINQIRIDNQIDTKFTEKSFEIIPRGYSKIINQFFINNTPFKVCAINSFPSNQESSVISFTPEKSPLVFTNIICYSMLGNEVVFKNEYYVSEISNVSKNTFIEIKSQKECENDVEEKKTISHKLYSPDKFFVTYTKRNSKWQSVVK